MLRANRGRVKRGAALPRSGVARDHPVAAVALGQLQAAVGAAEQGGNVAAIDRKRGQATAEGDHLRVAAGFGPERPVAHRTAQAVQAFPRRSDEHTSELQSLMRLSYAVSCFKKQKI